MREMINQTKKFHNLGFAIEWLKTKSKQPVRSGWTKGKRQSFGELSATYRQGLNVGVRLGEPSRLDDAGYLAVIDCDVKSADPKHKAQMERALGELFGTKLNCAPVVLSGRGGGSKHVYIRTKKPVAKGLKLKASDDVVEVLMPSVKSLSKREKLKLSEKKLAQGYRLRPAWEISLMGTGQQVVLPPSIHPDSNKPYEWEGGMAIDFADDMPMVSVGNVVEGDKNAPPKEKFLFTPVEVNLAATRLPPEMVAMIEEGEECDDRSVGLFVACVAMVKSGLTDDQILSVLTDRENYLGSAGYDHAKTNSRHRAALWVKRYTLEKVKAEHSADALFDDIVEVEELSDDEMAAESSEYQAKRLAGENWKGRIERTTQDATSPPKCTLKNLQLILTHSVGKCFARNEFTMTDLYAMATPWGGVKGDDIKDIDLIRIKVWFANKWRFEPATAQILEAVLGMADSNKFHPVRDFLKTLEWDGVERLDNWLRTYMGAVGPSEYIQAVGRKTVVAMIARVMQPGIKFDHVMVLEGRQGCGKSTAVRMLASPWGSDAAMNIGDKDAVLSMRSAWVMEVGELASMRRADVNQLKHFISQDTDRIRVPYGKLIETFPRQCIFIGTTNNDEYLKDETGNRRFWPVKVERCDFKALKRDRDQLLSEALACYQLGETIHLDEATEKMANVEQEKRVFVDEWAGRLERFFAQPDEHFTKGPFTMTDLFAEFGPLREYKDGRAEQMRAGDALRMLGYAKTRQMKSGERAVHWTKEGGIPARPLPHVKKKGVAAK